ncbi:MAG: prolyl oligopeptidase family serine peptidase [Planctomycetes bacterium]|nr:prolyl oligopeptidase family serine peptidase [Planctomycetota bacterium]
MRSIYLWISLWVLCTLCTCRMGLAQEAPTGGKADVPDKKGAAKAEEADAETQKLVGRFKTLYQILKKYQKSKSPGELLDDETYAALKLHHEKAYMGAKYYSSRETFTKEIKACEALLPKLGNTKDPFEGKTGFLERAYIAESDGSTQPYLVYVPTSAPKGAKLPVLAFLHGYAGDLDKLNWIQYMYSPDLEKLCEQEGFLMLMPFGRSNTEFMGIGEADVLKTIELVKKHYDVDADRVFLSGASMGGSGVYTIACHYPHLFAGAMAIAGRYDYYLWKDLDPQKFTGFKRIQNDIDYAKGIAQNLTDMSTFIFHGSNDFVIKIGQSTGMRDLLKGLGASVIYREITKGDHWIWAQCFQHEDYAPWLRTTRRNSFPKRVVYRTYTLKYNRAYWVTIDRLKRWGELASIDVEVKGGNRIAVTTHNVAALRLSLCDKLVDMTQPVKVVVNGAEEERKIGKGSELPIVIEKAKPAGALMKTHEICGPVREAYVGPFLFVPGTAGPEEATKRNQELCEAAAREWAAYSAGQVHMRADAKIDERDIADKNLILIGTPEDNAFLKRIADQLPVKFESDCYVVGAHKYPMKTHGLLMIYPNPLNPERYIVILSGMLWGEHLSINHKWDFVPDYIVFTAERDWDAMNKYLCAGYFNQNWQIDDGLIWFGKDEQNAKKGAGDFQD